MITGISSRRIVARLAFVVTLATLSTQMRADTGSCGGVNVTVPFTDVQGNLFFCAIAEAYVSGLTNGTSPTTYGPSESVTREQMAAFSTRTMNQSLKRGSQRAVAQQFWQPSAAEALDLGSVSVCDQSISDIAWDGTDVWVACGDVFGEEVTRVRASDGKIVGSYNAQSATDVLAAMGRIFITTNAAAAGKVFVIDPKSPPGTTADLLVDNAGPNPQAITFTGLYLWTANFANGTSGGSISRVPLNGSPVVTAHAGYSAPRDILWDGQNLWVADFAANQVMRVGPQTGTVFQTIAVGSGPSKLLFDGTNLWVCNRGSDSITVIRAVGPLLGTVLRTLTSNGLDEPRGLAFDGERVLVTNYSGNSVSLFKATDLTPLGSAPAGSIAPFPKAACSDGLNFFIARGSNDLVRF